MTQADFAKELGTPLTTLGRYERGESKPDISFLEIISSKFDVSLDWLILGAGEINLSRKTGAKQSAVAVTTCAKCGELMSRLNVANDRLYEATERERELLKENSELRAENLLIKNGQSSNNSGQSIPTA